MYVPSAFDHLSDLSMHVIERQQRKSQQTAFDEPLSFAAFVTHTHILYTHRHRRTRVISPMSSAMSSCCVLSFIDLFFFFFPLTLCVLFGSSYQGCLPGVLWVKDTHKWEEREKRGIWRARERERD